MGPDGRESSSVSHAEVNGVHGESKLELFGFDSLVNILGLRRYLMPFVFLGFFCLRLFPVENKKFFLW